MDTLDRLRAALAGRYDVEHELGRGGMAVVYLGRDLRHDRQVAIKVFEHGTGAGDAERFLREIRVAARLQHPNILPVFDSGEAEGLLYYVMPYVAGASLRERLEREGVLPVGEAVQVAREVALALDFAHQAGIVHRDIKPDNIMLAGGVAVVADFGIARALESSRLTETGMAIGTPAYMSPEQATASPVVDGRADLYSLGCVLYEMLAGAPPFSGPTGQAVMARHTADHVPPISTIRKIDPGLEAAVMTALAKTPADRWPTGRALADALSQAGAAATAPAPRASRRPALLAAAAVIVLTAAGALWLWRAGAARADDESARSVMVVPFAILGDSTRAHLAYGVAEAVVTALARIDDLRVPGLAASPAGSDEDARQLGRARGAAMVLTGTLEVEGTALRVRTRLLRVADGNLAWSNKYDGDIENVFDMQDSIADGVVLALEPRLPRTSRAVAARGVRTRDLQAYDLFVRAGRALATVRLDSVESAIRLYRAAIARDSLYADAWTGLAGAYSFYYQVAGVRPSEVAVQWRSAAERAIELDTLNGEAFAQRGSVRASYDWDWDAALRDLGRAVALAPGSPGARLIYSGTLNFVGRHAEALEQMHHAVRADPTSAFLQANLSIRYQFAGKLDSAAATAELALRLDSTQWVAAYELAEVYRALGRPDQSRRWAEQVLPFAGDSLPLALTLLASYYAQSGQPARAREMLNRLEALARRQYMPGTYLGRARAAVGDRAGALSALEESARNRDLDLTWDLTSGAYLSLDGDPRYEAVRRQVFGARDVPRNLQQYRKT